MSDKKKCHFSSFLLIPIFPVQAVIKTCHLIEDIFCFTDMYLATVYCVFEWAFVV